MKKILKIWFNEESGYSEENYKWQWRPSFHFFQPLQFEPEQKKTYGNGSHEKETKATDLSHIRIGNLNCCICGRCKNGAREIDCFCCRVINGWNAY